MKKQGRSRRWKTFLGPSPDLERLIGRLRLPGNRPGAKTDHPWWRLSPVSREEFRTNQRAVGAALIVSALILPMWGLFIQGGAEGVQRTDWLVLGVSSTLLSSFGLLVVKHANRKR
jgi:hypothetical protein